TAYTTKDKYVTYLVPGSKEFDEYVITNLTDKCIAYQYPKDTIQFKVTKVNFMKGRSLYFKNTFYKCYFCDLGIKVNFDTMKLIYETGLASKGSCGFGMVEIRNEKNNLSV
ncbi:MAG: hypothetical protein HUJ58_10215, partial [Erysipelotrichaceae bacterium]|nr:hypothetical protein [Erysipelotrichaceae bacterium]